MSKELKLNSPLPVKTVNPHGITSTPIAQANAASIFGGGVKGQPLAQPVRVPVSAEAVPTGVAIPFVLGK